MRLSKLIEFDAIMNRLNTMLNDRKISLLPICILFIFLFVKSTSYPLHDYSNSYFPALMAKEGIPPETIVFDIYDYNKYAWDKGYNEVFIDFYLNSPFTSTFFYPFALISNAYHSKHFFNSISILLFLVATLLLLRKFPKTGYVGFLLPLIFYAPLRSSILFGQSYLLITFILISSFWLLEKHKYFQGILLFSLGVLIKVFPIYYSPIFFLNKQWKGMIYVIPIAIALIALSVYTSGFGFWHEYLTQILPNAITNESTIDYMYNSQSFEVFLRTAFLRDDYYNPNAPFDNYLVYKIISFVIKGFIIGVLIKISSIHKKDLFTLLGIWIVAFFLLQSRTATYAQVLWIIPSFIYASNSTSFKNTAIFFITLIVISNFPYHWLRDSPLIIQYSRLWLSTFLAFMFFINLGWKFSVKYWIAGFTIILLTSFSSLSKTTEDPSSYVLHSRDQYFIYDFSNSNGYLTYSSIGRDGDQEIVTDIRIENFDSTRCKVVKNQIYVDQKQITYDPSLKKKPIMINECEVIYLTDRNSRRGTFTLKKISICGNK